MTRDIPGLASTNWVVTLLQLTLLTTFGSLTAPPSAIGQQESARNPQRGRNFIETPVYSAEEDKALLEKFQGLRVADVSDGMDRAGLKNVGLVSPDIVPLWRDTDHYRHRITGIAVTARYVPTNQPHEVNETDRSWSASGTVSHSLPLETTIPLSLRRLVRDSLTCVTTRQETQVLVFKSDLRSSLAYS